MHLLLKAPAVLLAPFLALLHVGHSAALVVNEGESVVIDYQVEEDVTVSAGGSLSVEEGGVINGRLIVEGALVVSGGSLPGADNRVFLEGSSSTVINGGAIDSGGQGDFFVQENAVVEVNGGEWNVDDLYVQGDASAKFEAGTYDVNRVYFQGDSVVKVSGGDWAFSNLYLQGSARTTLEGGVFSGEKMYLQGQSSTLVSGGEFVLEETFYFQQSSYQEIAGGSFVSNSVEPAFYYRNDSKTLISGGIFQALNNNLFSISANVEVTGGKINSVLNVGFDGSLSLVGPSFNYPFGTYEAFQMGGSLSGRLFSGEEISIPLININDNARVILERRINPALLEPVPTMAPWLLGVLMFLLGMLGWFRYREFG